MPMEPLWPWIATLALLVLLGALGAWWFRRRGRPDDDLPPGANERFSAVPAISPVQLDLLQYLVHAFAGRPVLFRAPLSHLVAVRGARDRALAQRRLAALVVDYVVCGRDGKPIFAFELDAAHDDAEQAAQDAAEKHRVLQGAGIRLIRIKRSTRDMPPPDEFRRRLRSAAIDPAATETSRPAPVAPSSAASTASARAAARPVRETEPMSLTGLMDLPPATDDDGDAWGSDRRHR